MTVNKYNKVYNFTNENVACLNSLYSFNNSKVITVVGSGDQCLSSILYGAKRVDLFDINPTSYLYFCLKFFSIRELSYDEFYDLLILKNFNNFKVYEKLESHLPLEVLKYYGYLLKHDTKKTQKNIFNCDGINLLSKTNKNYYLNNKNTVIPYFYKENYYKLKELLKESQLPTFYNCDIRNLKNYLNQNYEIMLLSNTYNYLPKKMVEFTELIKLFDIPQVQAHYDWYGFDIEYFSSSEYTIHTVSPASPHEYNRWENYVFSLKK